MNETMINPKHIPFEFSQRVFNLFLTCIEGMKSQVSEDDPLATELEKLSRLIKKVVEYKKKTELNVEIESHFIGKKIELDFRETEKEETKEIVLSMARAMNDVLTGVGDYDQNLGQYIEKIESTSDLNEILKIKDLIITETKKTRLKNHSFKKEIEVNRKETLELSNRIEQMKSKSLVDSLTKILNRTAYNMRINQVVRTFKDCKDPISLIAVDVDKLRDFNDNFDRKTGDTVIKSVADSLQSSIRRSDLVFRYGGEEFMVILTKAPLEQAQLIAEKARKQVEEDYFVNNGQELKATISLGVTGLKEGDTVVSLFERADEALSLAKEEGKNLVRVIQ